MGKFTRPGTLLQGQDRGTGTQSSSDLALDSLGSQLTSSLLGSESRRSTEMFVLPLEQKTPLLAAPVAPHPRPRSCQAKRRPLFLSHEQDSSMGSLFLFKQKGCQMLSLGAGRHIGPWVIHGKLNIFVPL